ILGATGPVRPPSLAFGSATPHRARKALPCYMSHLTLAHPLFLIVEYTKPLFSSHSLFDCRYRLHLIFHGLSLTLPTYISAYFLRHIHFFVAAVSPYSRQSPNRSAELKHLFACFLVHFYKQSSWGSFKSLARASLKRRYETPLIYCRLSLYECSSCGLERLSNIIFLRKAP